MLRAKYINKVTEVNKIYLENIINEDDVVIDATMGNGYDTVYLAKKVGPKGKVYAFDVQEEVSCIVFNLGYLPRAKHQIITKSDTTLEAIKKGLDLLKPNGVMSIAIYSGHEGGMEEKNAVYEFTQTLDQNYFNVLCTKFINQINNPPELLLIEKKG